MLVVLAMIFLASTLSWLYWTAQFVIESAKPNGGLAAYAVLNQAGTAATIIAVSAGAICIAERLDKLRKDLAARIQTTQPQSWPHYTPAPAPPQYTPPPRTEPVLVPTDSIVLSMDRKPVRMVVREPNGRLDEMDALLDAISGSWNADAFETLSVSYRKPNAKDFALVRPSEIRRIGEDQNSMTKDVQAYLSRLAVQKRDGTLDQTQG